MGLDLSTRGAVTLADIADRLAVGRLSVANL
jgi:hypothetical protein